VLVGGAGNDYFDGGMGVNFYFGGGGDNTFVSNDVPSVQVVQDWNVATATVQLTGSGFTSFADVLSHFYETAPTCRSGRWRCGRLAKWCHRHQFVSETLSVFGDHTLMVEADAIAEIEERRKSTRAEVDEVAFISVAGSSTRCRIVNVSGDGAAVDVPDAAYIPNRFRLMTERDRLVRNCRIAWIKENRIGVEFERAPEEQPPITHRERQFLQYLRDGGWRRAGSLPDSAKLISKLLWNGWIERRGSGNDAAYRITPKGLDAKIAPVKL
jgi:Ca2+-binding RTX toxin-like protein